MKTLFVSLFLSLIFFARADDIVIFKHTDSGTASLLFNPIESDVISFTRSLRRTETKYVIRNLSNSTQAIIRLAIVDGEKYYTAALTDVDDWNTLATVSYTAERTVHPGVKLKAPALEVETLSRLADPVIVANQEWVGYVRGAQKSVPIKALTRSLVFATTLTGNKLFIEHGAVPYYFDTRLNDAFFGSAITVWPSKVTLTYQSTLTELTHKPLAVVSGETLYLPSTLGRAGYEVKLLLERLRYIFVADLES